MIPPINWLWKQFNGPQITAFATAIFNWFSEQFNSILYYWQHLSIDTATSEHLTTIGALQGISRPLMNITPETFFWFSEVPADGTYYPSDPYRKSEHGLSDVADMAVGGKFADITEASKVWDYLSTPLYRTILQAARDSEGEQGSLVYLDDILFKLYTYLNPTATQGPYKINILTVDDVSTTTRSPGDIKVNLGAESEWGDSFSEIVAEVDQLGKTMYYPMPTMFATADI